MSGSGTLTLGQATIYTADTGLPHAELEKHPDQPDMLDAINTLHSKPSVFVILLTPDRKDTMFYPCGLKDIYTIQYQCSLQLIFLCTANSEMDKSSEKFTAEEVCKFLGLNDDYSNSSSSSSSDTNSEDGEFTYPLCDNYRTISETNDEEEIIPPSPKRIRTIIGNEQKNCQEYK